MNPETIERIINALAEKLGVAVEKVQPIALETIHQFQLRGMVLTAIGFILLALVPLLVWRCAKAAKAAGKADTAGDSGETASSVIIAVVAGIAVLACAGIGAPAFGGGIADWVAPLPQLLGL